MPEGRWVPISELLEAYEERAAEEQARSGPRGESFACRLCEASFGREVSLAGHMRRRHPNAGARPNEVRE